MEDGQEIWRPVPGYRGTCDVSNFGRVRCNPRPCRNARANWIRKSAIRKLTTTSHGYLVVPLRIDGKATNKYVHRLVCEVFNGACPDGKVSVNHIDGNKQRNVPSNLEWTSHQENTEHSLETGLAKRGSQHHFAKLTEMDAVSILADKRGCVKLSKQYGVTPSAIKSIRSGKSWRHLQGLSHTRP